MALIPQGKPQQIALGVIVGSILALYVFHAYWYTPRIEVIDELTVRLTELQDKNRMAQMGAARQGANLEEKLAIYERHMDRLEELIPGEDEVSALLNSMSVEARRAGVEISSMNPGPTQEDALYTRQIYDLAVWGEYHDVGRFLTAVASLPRIVTPIDLEVEPAEQAEGRDGLVAPVVARFRIETYVLPDDSGEIPDLPDGVDPALEPVAEPEGD